MMRRVADEAVGIRLEEAVGNLGLVVQLRVVSAVKGEFSAMEAEKLVLEVADKNPVPVTDNRLWHSVKPIYLRYENWSQSSGRELRGKGHKVRILGN